MLEILVQYGESISAHRLRLCCKRHESASYFSLLVDPLPSAIVMRHDYSFTVHQIVLSVDEFSIRR
jgi:hypothetical protein